MKDKLNNAYQKLAGASDYVKNSHALKIASWAVTGLSAIATAVVNSFAHVAVIGFPAAVVLAILIFIIVEGLLLITNHGLLHCYTNNVQRFWATVAYWIIKITMVLNLAVLGCFLAGAEVPSLLQFWNHWAFAVHAGLAVIMLDLIRNSDSVKQHQMAELRAATAEQDALTARRLASYTSGILFASRLKGVLDGLKASWNIFWQKSDFPKQFAARVQEAVDGRPSSIRPGNQTQLQPQIITPTLLPAPARPRLKSGKTSGLAASMPDLPQIKWEDNARGGIEAWHNPPGAINRADRTYLGYLRPEIVTGWIDNGTLEDETTRWVSDLRAQKNIA